MTNCPKAKVVPDFVELRGYAAPFNRPRFVAADNIVESIAPAAFDGMLDDVAPIPVLWDSHNDGAPVLSRSVKLHTDGYGLGFSALVDVRNRHGCLSPHWGRLRAMMQRRAPMDQCSVSLVIERSHIESGVRHVTAAKITHVTICSNAVYGAFTGAWLAHCIDEAEAPWRLQVMNAEWQAGRELFSLTERRRKLINEATAIANGPGQGVNGDLSAEQLAQVRTLCAASGVIDLRRRATCT